MSTTPAPMSEDQDWIVVRACSEHYHNHMMVFRWGPPPHHPCPNCSYRPILEKVHIEGDVPSVEMTEERLKEIEGRTGRDLDRVDVLVLLGEVRRLQQLLALYRAIPKKHASVSQGYDVEAILLERARENAELLAQVETLKRAVVKDDELIEDLKRQRDQAQSFLRRAAEGAREIREVLFIGQKIPIAMAAVDQYNALLSALASREGLTEIEKARTAVVDASVKTKRVSDKFSEAWSKVDWADKVSDTTPALVEYERVQQEMDAVWEEWDAAIAALEKLESAP